MKYLYRLAAFTIFFSFMFGFIWSAYLKRPDDQTHTFTLTLLVPNQLEAMGFSKSITEHSDIKIIPIIYSTFEQLEAQLEKSGAEAVVFPSATASRLIETKLIPPLSQELSEFLSFVHVDFKNLGHDPHNTYTLPLFWGVNGMASAEDGSETVNVSLIDDFVQKHFLKIQDKSELPSSTFHNLTQKDLLEAKSERNLIQIPVSYFPLFESLPEKKHKTWTFNIPESDGHFWVLSLGLKKPSKSESAKALIQHFLSKNFETTFLKDNPISVTYLTLQNLPENQEPNFLRTLPLKKIKIREISSSSLRESTKESEEK